MLLAQLAQEAERGRGGTVALDLHRRHLARLQADNRVVGPLLQKRRTGRVDQRGFAFEHPLAPQVRIAAEQPFVDEEDLRPLGLRLGRQRGVQRDKGVTLLRVYFQESLLRALEDEAQPMQVVQTTAPTPVLPEAVGDELAHRFPVLVSHRDPLIPGRHLDSRLQCGLGLRCQGGGEPPVCLKASPAGPDWRKRSTHPPTVWVSRSKASATWAWDQPRASNQRACPRSRGVGAR